MTPRPSLNKQAIQFVVLIGFVSFFADMTYEGARSILGPYLAALGATGFAVGMISGVGELIGYALRLFSGLLADRFQRYWLITWIGYSLNMISVPLLALAGAWPFAAACVFAERTGKAIRVPARDAMLSYAAERMGPGWGFGLHEAMDQCGATLGPLLITLLIYCSWSLKLTFAWLAIPAAITLLVLALANRRFPRPQDLEVKTPDFHPQGLNKTFWIYTLGGIMVAAGYVDFPLIAFHFAKAHLMPEAFIPLSYALAMIVSAASALIFGYAYDRFGIGVLLSAIFLAAFASPLVFLGNEWEVFVGMAIWGLGMGSQAALLKALIIRLTPGNKRASAYGIFNMAYGIAWFAGSVLMGALYDYSLKDLVIASVILQWLALPFVLWVKTLLHHKAL